MVLFIVEPYQKQIVKEIDLLEIIEEEYENCQPLGFSYLNEVNQLAVSTGEAVTLIDYENDCLNFEGKLPAQNATFMELI